MSSIYSAASAVSASASNGPGCEPSRSAKRIERAKPSSESTGQASPIFDDVRTLNADMLPTDIDVICGGFPCQDISLAGKGLGLAGERSGLWFEYARIIGEIGPRYVIVENVAALLGRGLDRVLGDLAALRLDAEWHCIPASATGARHRRDRLWIMAYAQSERRGEARADSERYSERPAVSGDVLADADSEGLPLRPPFGRWLAEEISGFARMATERCGCPLPDADSEPEEWAAKPWCERHPWFAEPAVGRVADGVPGRVDRLKQLGNAVTPIIPEAIGRVIMRHALTGGIGETAT